MFFGRLPKIEMSSKGFGIAGHKNVYSRGVKIGNYVEDRRGESAASSLDPVRFTATSEVRAQFVNPGVQTEAEVDPELLSRQGLSYQMMFAHGPGIEVDPTSHSQDLWRTSNNRVQGQESSQSRQRELQKRIAREKRSANNYVTVTQNDSRFH